MDDRQPPGDVPIERPCGTCNAAAGVLVTQTVVGERIAWSVSLRCRQCGAAEEQCGWDVMPDHWREILVAQDGLARVHADLQSSRPLKVRLLSVFRDQGSTIAEALMAFKSLTGAGIVGTSAEMRLLARLLTNAGAIVSLTPEARSHPGRPGHDTSPIRGGSG
ncbi:hypothetical protein [Actinoplanes sp. NPDC026670]|uniref:hypothetical protein n=1 Tax=Actinoplanes sp. NPDC026670 TaxID=3154700 RepID=UPI003407DEAD